MIGGLYAGPMLLKMAIGGIAGGIAGTVAAPRIPNPKLRFESGFEPIPFSAEGALDQETLFPESLRSRRGRNGEV